MSTTMTVHRALALIKKTKQELQLKTSSHNQSLFISTVFGNNNKPTLSSFKTEEELRSRLQSDTDSMISSLELIPKLQEAIAKSNLETKVVFAGKEVSITKLLAIKQTLEHRSNFLNVLQKQSISAQNAVNAAELKIQSALDVTDVTEMKTTMLTSLTNLYGVNVITSNKNKTAATMIKEVTDEITYLTHEVDTILSEMNVSTLITIED